MVQRSGPFIELIYAGLEDPSAWKTFLEQFALAMDCQIAALRINYPEHPESLISVSVGETKEFWLEVDKWVGKDPWAQRVALRDLRPGELRRSNEICPDEEVEANEMYRKVLKPRSLHYGGGLVFAASKTQVAIMDVLRSKAKGPLSEDEFTFWRGLSPHLMRAARIQEAQTKLRAEREVLISHFDDAGAGLILMNHDGRVLLANSLAQGLLQRADGLRCVEGLLYCVSSRDDRRLKEVLHGLCSGPGNDAAEPMSMIVSRADARPSLLLILSRSGSTCNTARVMAAPPILVRIIDPLAGGRIDSEPLRQLFGLSPAEANMVCLLAQGLRLQEAAESLHVSVHTARTHLAHAFDKTGAANQGQLISLALRTTVRRDG